MSILSELGPPYFLVRASARASIAGAEYGTYSGVVVRKIRGRKAQTLKGLMTEFGAALQFFDEFGENWHALEEMLCYMDEWLSGDGYVIVITSAQLVLQQEPDQFTWFLRVLYDVGEWWSSPVEGNGRFDRAALPFKTVMEVSGDREADAFIRRIESLGFDAVRWEAVAD